MDKVRQINRETNTVETVMSDQTRIHFDNQSNTINEVTSSVSGLTIDRNGGLYFSTNFNNQLLKFNTKTSLVTPIQLTSTGSASHSFVSSPGTLFILTSGPTDTLFIADRLSHRIHKMDLSGANLLVSVAGSGVSGSGGDGGPATSCSLGEVRGLWGDSSGHHLYFSDTTFNVVRRVTASTGMVSLLVGTAHHSNLFREEDVSVTSASLSGPMAIWGDGSSNSIFIADSRHNRVTQVDTLTRIMTTTAGGDQRSRLDSGGVRTSVGMAGPAGVWGDSRGSLFVTEPSQGRVRQISLDTGLVSHFVGVEPLANANMG
jgi:sugar lactone lactonase YvrE